jgi:hypothetical protein
LLEEAWSKSTSLYFVWTADLSALEILVKIGASAEHLEHDLAAVLLCDKAGLRDVGGVVSARNVISR